MKAKKKTNHLQEEADKIEHIPEEKNNGRDGQEKPGNAKKPRKNRILACLRKTWARITGCMRGCTSIQEDRSAEELPKPRGINIEEELPTPSGIDMEEELREPSSTDIEDPKANLSYEEQEREVDVEENQNIKTNNEEAELVTDSFVEQEIQAEYQRLNDLIHSQENLCAQYYATQWEILAEYNCINDQIQNLENLYIQHYNAEDEQNEEEQLEINVEDNQEVKNKEVEEDGLKNSESTKNSQRASCVMPGPSHTNGRDNESSKGKEKDNDKGKNTSIDINKQMEECRSEESNSKGTSLEEELHETMKTSQSGSSNYRSDFRSLEEELYKSIKTSQSRSSHYRSDSCSLGEETPEELYKSANTSQSDSSHYEETISSNICMKKPEQPGKGTPATVPLTLQSFMFHEILGMGSFGEVYLARDNIRNECVAIKAMTKWYFTGRAHNFVERNILKLSHESPHLIHGLAAFHTEQCVYYVMELATRGDLYNFMDNNHRLDRTTIQFIISEVICGIQFLHKKGIIHRDLKPGNILLTADGHVKITDFGLAVMDANKRKKGRCVGTVLYMAPEMVRRQEHGEGVDYFAIGVILYRMHTYELPFTGRNAKAVKRAILYHTPKYPEFLTPDTLNVLLGLLHKDQHHRLGVEGDVRKHPYFSNISWEDVEARRVVPPAIMTAASVNLDVNQILHYAEQQNKIRSKHQQIFKEFSFICTEWSHQYHPVDTIDTIETKSRMAKLFARRPFKKKAN